MKAHTKDAKDAKVNLSCGPGCGHTPSQHEAFDSGFRMGIGGATEADCPAVYQASQLKETWLTGRSAGACGRVAA
jgi:ribosome modulation factor